MLQNNFKKFQKGIDKQKTKWYNDYNEKGKEDLK